MKKKEIKQKIEEGYIRATIVFEVLGSPKKHVETSIKEYVGKIKQDPQILFLEEDYGETQSQGKGLFSTFCEVDVLLLGIEKLTWLCFNFMPASIEITDPAQMTFRDRDLTHWLNDLLSQLHELSTYTKAANSKNQMLQKNINALVFNAINLSLTESKTAEEISKSVGLPADTIKQFLQKLVEEKKVVHHKDKYTKV